MREILLEPETTTSARPALGTASTDAAPALSPSTLNPQPSTIFDPCDQLAASHTSLPVVEPAVAASRECGLPTGYSEVCTPTAAVGADNHGRCTGTLYRAGLLFGIHHRLTGL